MCTAIIYIQRTLICSSAERHEIGLGNQPETNRDAGKTDMLVDKNCRLVSEGWDIPCKLWGSEKPS